MEVTPNYSYVFDFENEFIHQDTRKWMIKNWTWVFYYCGVYMLIIFGGQFWMQNRPRWVKLFFFSFYLKFAFIIKAYVLISEQKCVEREREEMKSKIIQSNKSPHCVTQHTANIRFAQCLICNANIIISLVNKRKMKMASSSWNQITCNARVLIIKWCLLNVIDW